MELYCKDCGCVVEPIIKEDYLDPTDRLPFWTEAICPRCGGDDLCEIGKCERCGEPITHDEDYCQSCINDIGQGLTELMEALHLDPDMFEDMVATHFKW